MSNAVEIVLKLKDLLSVGMQKAATVTEQALSTIQISSVSTTNKINDTAKAVANLTGKVKILAATPTASPASFPTAPMTTYGTQYTQMYQRVKGGMNSVAQGAINVEKNIRSGLGRVREFGSNMWDASMTAVKGVGEWGKSLFKHRQTMNMARGAVMDMMSSTSILETVQQATGISTQVWSAAQEVLNIVMSANPIGIVVMAITGLVLWIKHLVDHNKYWAESLKSLWEVIKNWALSQFTIWKMVGETIWQWIRFAWLKVESFVQYVSEAMSRIGQSIQLAVNGDFSGAAAIFDKQIKTKASVELVNTTNAYNNRMAGYQKDLIGYQTNIYTGLAKTVDKAVIGWQKRNEAGTDPTKTTATTAAPKLPKAPKIPTTRLSRPVSEAGSGGRIDRASNEITSGGSKTLVINIKELGNNFVQNNYSGNSDFKDAAKHYKEELLRMLQSFTNY